VPQERSASPDLESLRPVLGVMTEIQARYVVDLHHTGGPAAADLPARLALADERGAEAVASASADPVLAGQQALAFGAAVWSALTALPDHSANEHKRLLKAAYAAYDQREDGADAAGLNAALESTRRAAALAAEGRAAERGGDGRPCRRARRRPGGRDRERRGAGSFPHRRIGRRQPLRAGEGALSCPAAARRAA
jgi:hypothetical protein